MSTRAFCYNPSPNPPIPGTEQIGDIAAAISQVTINPSLEWWNGPDEDLGYIIAYVDPSGNRPNGPERVLSINYPCHLGFFRTSEKTDESFVELTQIISGTTSITSATQSKEWLNNNGYWTSYVTWEILMMYSGKKTSSSNWIGSGFNSIRNSMGSPGTSAFMTMSSSSTESESRNNIGDGVGLYKSFFTKNNITKIALIDGSGGVDPLSNTNYLVYDLVESTGSETINDILKRLDIYQRDSDFFHGNDNVWGTPSVINHTAGINGYSGLISASGGNGFKTTISGMPGSTPQIPDKFVIMGINRDSDNDIQALSAFWGNLNIGKGDSWRGDDPYQTFWSYWGHDFHSNSKTQRIGSSLQTAPGVSTGASWTGDVYLVAFSN
jgi:hypothetical protein